MAHIVAGFDCAFQQRWRQATAGSKLALMVPMTHQLIGEDRAFALEIQIAGKHSST